MFVCVCSGPEASLSEIERVAMLLPCVAYLQSSPFFVTNFEFLARLHWHHITTST